MPDPKTGLAVWLTGAPASGKSTLAQLLKEELTGLGHRVEVLDSDRLRSILTPEPRYTPEERDWFYSTLVYLAGLLTRHGVWVLIAATGHLRSYRDRARGELPLFFEVYVKCPAEIRRRRDPKGLYRAARRGSSTSLPGEQVPYQEPLQPEAVVNTSLLGPVEAANRIKDQLDRAGLL